MKKVVLVAFVLVLLSLVSVAGLVRPVVDSLPIHNIDSNKVIAQTNSTTIVYLDPPTINGTVVGQEFTVNLNVRGAQDVYSWQAGIAFNPNVLNCTGFFEGQFLSNVGETFWVQGTVNNSVGLIRPCGCTLLGDLKASGDGRLAYVTFKVKSPGVSDLHLLDVLFADWIETQPGTWEPVMIPTNITDVFTIVVDTIPQTVIAVSNSTGSDGEYGSGFYDHAFSLPAEKISFKVTGPYPGWSNVTIPKTLLNVSTLDELRVAIDGILLSTGERTVTENATHYSIYFTYNAGIHYVQITTHALISGTISITLSSTSITLGSNVTVSGDIDPLKPSVTVAILYRYKAPEGVKFYRWTALGILTTDPNSHFNYTWTPKEVGTYEFMAMWEGDDSTFGDVSDVKTLTVKPKPKTWTVDDDELADFHAIQEAINAASPGDTIYVYNGTYCEHVVVNKSLSLVGESRDITFIDGNGTGIVVTIEADAVVINNFTVQNGGLHFTGGGIVLYKARDCMIEGNIVTNNFAGIYLSVCSNNTIKQNAVTDNGWGIRLLDSNNNTVKENAVTNNYRGFFFVYSGNNALRNNSMTSNVYNFNVAGDELSHFLNYVDASNTVDGRTVYYFINENGLTINPSTFPNAGYLAIVNSTCITVQNLNLTNNGDGILLAYTNNSKIENVNITNNWVGFHLLASNGNIFSGNRAIENAARCVELSDSSNNTFIENMIAKNGDGFCLSGSDNNTFIRNTVTNSYRGVYMSGSSNNVIYHNSFINNTNQVIVQSGAFMTANTWDDGYPSGGNYWSDYNGTDSDSDGIGDAAYAIDANNTDNYPLMGMFSDFPAIHPEETYHVTTICNSTISDFDLVIDLETGNLALWFDVAGPDDTVGFCRIVIPRDLMEGPYTIFVDGEEVTASELPILNSTHVFLYFTYIHSKHHVVIIPEFPTWASMLLILIVLTVSIAIYKLRIPKRRASDSTKTM